jgi:hypothetical protein
MERSGSVTLASRCFGIVNDVKIHPVFRLPDCVPTFFAVFPFFATGRSLWTDRRKVSMRFTTVEGSQGRIGGMFIRPGSRWSSALPFF